jgi:carbon monoxide dehydrogenase subunit G
MTMRRGSVRREVEIAVPAERAWAVVGRPELLHTWFPGIVACEVDGDERTIHTGTGMTLPEKIVTNDPTQRRFQYQLTGGFFAEHLGTVDVVALGDERCLVTYSSDVRPAAMALILGGATHGALRELQRQLEAGAGPALDALERRPEET